MKVLGEIHNIFPKGKKITQKFELDPQILRTRILHDENDKRNKKEYDIELYCVVDQRKLFEGNVKKILAFISKHPVGHYGERKSAFSEVDMKDRKAVNNIVYDMINIKENRMSEKFNL